MSNSALILVDIQNDYFEGGRWPVDRMARVAENAARLLSRYRDASLPGIHVRHEFASDAAPFFVAGTPGAEIHASVAPTAGETVVVKGKANSFRDTSLKEQLDRAGITDIVICGAMTQMCIDATTRAAADYGYGVTVVSDACGAKAQEFDGVAVSADQVQAAILAPLAMSYARVVTTDAFLES